MRENDVIIRLVINILIINFYGLMILTKIIPVLLEIKELMVALVEIWCLTLYLFHRSGKLTLIVPCYFGHSSANMRYKIAL